MGERLRLLVTLSLSLVCAQAAIAFLDPSDPNVRKFVVTADDDFSRAVTSEYTANGGGVESVRCKSNQEMFVMQFGLSSLAGQTITDAELHVYASSTSRLYAADVSTICVPWTEGQTANAYDTAAVGEPCWLWRRFPGANAPQPGDYWLPGAGFSSATFDVAGNYWIPNGQDFTYATYGNNGSLVSWAYADDSSFTTYSASGKTVYRIKLDPDIVHALILDQYGLTLSDTRGYLIQNNTVYSREYPLDPLDGPKGIYAPFLYIKGGVTDVTAPGPVTGFAAQPGDWNGQVIVSCVAPTDSGPTGKAFGYDVRYSTTLINDAATFAVATRVDRWRIVRPGTPGTTQKMLVEGLTPNTTYYFAIKAYDQAGNAAPMVVTSVVLPATQTVTQLANGGFAVPTAATSVPTVPNVLRYWAVSDYTKVNPVNGNRRADNYTGAVNDGYKMGNPVWDAVNNKVVLKASRNEVVAFQLILEKLVASLTNVQVSVSNLTGPGTISASPNIELFRSWYIRSGSPYYPGVCIPLTAPFGTSFAIPNATNAITGQTNQAVWVDIYVPKATPAGTYTGTITVTANQLTQPLTISLQLSVRSWQLPDMSTFIVDLNGYGAPWNWGATSQDVAAIKRSYFQLAQKHRQIIDTVPQSHSLNNAANNYSARFNDSTRQFELTGDGANISVSDWTTFDSYWGQYLDGTVFSAAQGYNGPGANMPISMFFLPFFESYPLSSYWWYDATGWGGAYWYSLWPGNNGGTAIPPISFLASAPNPAAAYPSSYETGLKNVTKAFMEHAQAKGWYGTCFEYFHNNKNHYGTLANPHSQFWNLDEPSDGDCMQALGYFHKIWREGVSESNAPNVKSSCRIDISDRTGMHRGVMDGRVNLWCSSRVDDYRNLLPNRQLRWTDEKWWYYGGGSDSTGSELSNTKRFVQVWAWGIDGALPYWESFSRQNVWTSDGDPYPVFFSGQNVPGLGSLYKGALPSVRMKEMRRGQQDIEYLAYLAQCAGWSRPAVIRAMQAKYADTGGQAYSGMNELSFFKMREDVAATIPAGTDFNTPPVVDIPSAPSVVYSGDAVSVNGIGFDADGDVLTYAWVQTGGSPVTLSNTTTPTVSFAAPAVPTGVTYTTVSLRLTVSDGRGGSASDTVTITVLPKNLAPVVNVGGNQTITMPASATLSGTATDDGLPNPPAALAVTWNKLSGPGVVTFAQVNVAATTATFSLPGTYVLQLAGYDGALMTKSEVTITVNPAPNNPPVVDTAVGPAFVYEGWTAEMTCTTHDSDAGDFVASYAWTQTGGKDVGVITGAATAGASFTVPTLALLAESVLTFQIVATDTHDVDSTPRIVTVPAYMIGDITHDGYVNIGDLQALVAVWNVHASGLPADMNGDTYVNVGDLQSLVANWGRELTRP